MSHSVKQPVTQKRLTNIAIVKYKSHGKRFEVACFRNKVQDWRAGKEKDIHEVLQTMTVFSNVGKGVVIKSQELQKVFGAISDEEICRIIIEKGELQVSDKEREQHLEELFRDVATLCTERLVHASTGRALTVQMVSNALRSVHFSLTNLHDSAKKHSLKAIELLTTKMPDSFARANMRLCIVADSSKAEIDEKLEELCKPLVIKSSEVDETNGSYSVVFECEPRCYRALDQLVTSMGKKARLQVIESCVVEKEGVEKEGVEKEGVKKNIVLEESREAATASTEPLDIPVQKPGSFCSTCQQSLTVDFRKHCQTDLHAFNVKRKVKKLPPMDEEEFLESKFDAAYVQNFRSVD